MVPPSLPDAPRFIGALPPSFVPPLSVFPEVDSWQFCDGAMPPQGSLAAPAVDWFSSREPWISADGYFDDGEFGGGGEQLWLRRTACPFVKPPACECTTVEISDHGYVWCNINQFVRGIERCEQARCTPECIENLDPIKVPGPSRDRAVPGRGCLRGDAARPNCRVGFLPKPRLVKEKTFRKRDLEDWICNMPTPKIKKGICRTHS